MHCRLTLAAALVAAMILPTAHASADCKGDVEGIEKRIKQAKVRATYKGREAEHPEVLIMTGGKLVDLTGYMLVDASTDSWANDAAIVAAVAPMIAEAKGFFEKKQEPECMAVSEKIQAAIKASSGG